MAGNGDRGRGHHESGRPGLNSIAYFAHGPYLLLDKLRFDGIGSAEKISNAVLHGYRLRLNRRSVDGSFKANIERTSSRGDIVLGVLWSVDRNDVPALKRAEGCPAGTGRRGWRSSTNGDADGALTVLPIITIFN